MIDVGRLLVWLALITLAVLCWIGAYTVIRWIVEAIG